MTAAPSFGAHFGDFDGRIWLNTAHQGALPLGAAEAARAAILWKCAPKQLTQSRFDGVPARLRKAIARLVGAPEAEIVLANSASFGIHLIADSFRWKEGDEVLVMATDFPSDIFPWLTLAERHGVVVRQMRPAGRVVSADELRDAITPRTRLFCTTWVHSFSGHAIDIAALGDICRAHDVFFLVNSSQAIGARVAEVTRLPVDALTNVGFKWLCGPYGTGFVWLSARWFDRLQRTRAYWLSSLTAKDLEAGLGELRVGPIASGRDLDVFGTANFFNFTALAAAIELHLDLGREAIAAHDAGLVDLAVEAVRAAGFRLVSPAAAGPLRSTLVIFDHARPDVLERTHAALAEAKIDVAKRAGALRIAPHLYNTAAHIAAVADCLRAAVA